MIEASFDIAQERWLVCAPELFEDIRRICHAEASPGSLGRLRLESSLVEHVTPDSLRDRIAQLAAGRDDGAGRTRGPAPVHVVVASFGESDVMLMDSVARQGIPIRLHVWDRGPNAVIDSLYLPEETVLAAWSNGARRPTIRRWGMGDAEATMKYGIALMIWEGLARQEHGERFDELYGPQWLDLPLAEAGDTFVMRVTSNAAGLDTSLGDARIGRAAADGSFVLTIVMPSTLDEDAIVSVKVDPRLPRLDEIIGFEVAVGGELSLQLGMPSWVEDSDGRMAASYFEPIDAARFADAASSNMQVTIRRSVSPDEEVK